eukprot:TRINITY_DN5733_c0_g1_i4.p1 TRINITY_DN5733_c0_g1~~TRINITY_DN5733_c0_g1_i4.p1  ORF type:complete len:217 (-),score=24.41 TRINITY_DN5733_c0_g1_i4:208-777(-)
MCIRDRSNTHHHSSGSKGGTTSIGYGNSEGNSFVDISGKDSMKDSHAAVLPKTEFVVEQLDHVIKINVHTGYDSSKNETKHRSKSNGRANGLISATTPSSQTHIPVEQGPARRRGVGAHGVAIDAKKHNQTNQSYEVVLKFFPCIFLMVSYLIFYCGKSATMIARNEKKTQRILISGDCQFPLPLFPCV